MRDVLDKKLDKISDIWNNYIWEYKFCNSKIKFTPDVKSNYFGDILSYFSDTFNLIYNSKKADTFSENIETSISFLQAIYIQQDFIEELLHIFKCDIDKGDLKKDENYTINRELRNELVGHPIRKSDINGTRQLLSSTIFSNSTNADQISYLRYHLDNNYKFEEVTHNKEDILKRHSAFVEFYFDIIIEKLKGILSQFKTKIEEIEKVVANAPFENVVKIVSDSFEYIFRTDHLYKPDILLEVYKLKNTNRRYSNAIEMFQRDLNQFLIDKKQDIDDLVNDTDRFSFKQTDEEIIIPEIIFVESNDKVDTSKIPVSYHYELGKLVDRSDFTKFRFFSSLLKSKCKDKELVLAEIENMEMNLDNTLEYYCSFHLVETELNGVENASR
ncbi:MAG: hypothetical protein KGZ74_13080 [Chitinophagaceae bacterium]|nr:hypothetical protein [Chitinophagaceae bacterium]